MVKGQRYRSPAEFLTKKAAQMAMAQWLAEYQSTGRPPSISQTPSDSGPITTVIDVLEKRLAWLAGHGSPRHQTDTRSLFKLAMRFGDFWDKPAEQLTTTEVLAWAEEYREEISAKAANRALRYLGTAFNGPYESKRLPRTYPLNPFLVPLFPEDHTPPYVPPDADVEACLASVDDVEKRLFLRLLAETAARQGEARALRREDLELGRGLVVLYTSKKRGGHRWPRRVPLGPELIVEMEQWLAGVTGEWVFPSQAGEHRTCRWALNLQIRAAGTAGVKYFSLHSYRHWRACKWATEGLRLSQIKNRLGHETLQVTEHYLRSLGMEIEKLGL